ncbi:Ribonuclease H [Senna tora]|uniref:Ribonuclease H n=1 Tax=Senna tora TaxID=362788 RepID=A0A834T732_9FABA|nr:Ribonuclease H [Senna tora]
MWARVLRAKNRCGDDIIPQMYASSNASRLWKAVEVGIGLGLSFSSLLTFVVARWSLWRWRNESIFKIDKECVEDPYFTIINRVQHYLDAFRQRLHHQVTKPGRVSRIVKWNKPEDGWVKVNVERSSSIDESMKGARGGVMCDHLGNYIVWFA